VPDASVPAPEVIPTMRDIAPIVGAPDFFVPWLDRLYDEDYAELVLAAAAGTLAEAEPERLARAVRRAVLSVDAAGVHTPASLHERLEIWAMLEGWKDVPLAVHRRLADWDVDYYAESIREGVEAARDGRPDPPTEAGYAYVLLHEAEAVIREQEHVYLWPCDCRSIVSKCRKPMNVCLRFDNNRGLGWEISRERAIEILRQTDKAGLMHTDYVSDRPSDPHAICNCCTDCCYPHLASERLGAGDIWPVRRYVADIDMDVCTNCGRCGLRCPFEAIVCSTGGRPVFDASRCRGCGLCATGCSPEAIAMRPLTKAGA
jgi:Pyruvate/2-oxoacid:ferredoxin oxidoreductase delta subunit